MVIELHITKHVHYEEIIINHFSYAFSAIRKRTEDCCRRERSSPSSTPHSDSGASSLPWALFATTSASSTGVP